MMRRFFSAWLTAHLVLAPICWNAFLQAGDSSRIQVAQDTQLKLILKTHLSTRTSRPGDAFNAELADPEILLAAAVHEGSVDQLEHPRRA